MLGNRPLNKVSGGAAGGAGLGLLIAWLYQQLTGQEMPVEVAIVLASLLGGITGYLIPLEARLREALQGQPLPLSPEDLAQLLPLEQKLRHMLGELERTRRQENPPGLPE